MNNFYYKAKGKVIFLFNIPPPTPPFAFQTFEDNIRKNRTVISNWIKYAQWEESLKEIQR